MFIEGLKSEPILDINEIKSINLEDLALKRMIGQMIRAQVLSMPSESIATLKHIISIEETADSFLVQYAKAEQKEELAFLTRDYSYKLDEMLELGLFTEGQIQRAKGKLRKAVIQQIKNNEVREEE